MAKNDSKKYDQKIEENWRKNFICLPSNQNSFGSMCINYPNSIDFRFWNVFTFKWSFWWFFVESIFKHKQLKI